MRVEQPAGERGSLKWIQRAVNERWPSLVLPIQERIGRAAEIEWLSPLGSENFAEHRDGSFLKAIGCIQLAPALRAYWPSRGPQWDALGKTSLGDILLVEAKAHVEELCSPGTKAGEVSRQRIDSALSDLADRLGGTRVRASWSEHFYQLANRLAHLSFLRAHGVPAWLVLVNFIGDRDMNGPSSRETWEAAYQVAFHVMGLAPRHPLSPYVLHVYPDVSAIEDSR